jgi:transposase-like protein
MVLFKQGEKAMNAEDQLIRHRLSVLEPAQTLGNVSEACRQRGVSRTQFYEYKRRFQTHGLEGLKDLPPTTTAIPSPHHRKSQNGS